jgi:hypothetical protein
MASLKAAPNPGSSFATAQSSRPTCAAANGTRAEAVAVGRAEPGGQVPKAQDSNCKPENKKNEWCL